MNTFEKYFLMNEEDVIKYVRKKTDFFKESHYISAIEIGDGNLNYVFRVQDQESGDSIILKQAGEALRINSDMKLPVIRGKHEYETYLEFERIVSDMVPKVYFYDETMCVIAMEDMKNYEVMRSALLKKVKFDGFSSHITDYFSKLFYMTDLYDDKKKEKTIKFLNPELCKITEDLVFTYPYCIGDESNDILQENIEFVKKEIFDDSNLKFAVAKLKYKFMNCTQSLIHGDLHTGSIFVSSEKTCIFDPEFSFYGPIGYDIGNVLANLFFAFLYNCSENDTSQFGEWTLRTIESIVDDFICKFNHIYTRNGKDNMFNQGEFKKYIIDDILADTAGYMGTEIIRRIVGMAKNKDITMIENKETRAKIERIGIRVAKECIINNQYYINGKRYKETIVNMYMMNKEKK